jgi:hypothetical protein
MNKTRMAALRVLAFAAATGRVGSVFLIGEKLVDWHISNKAAESGIEAAAHAQSLINDLMPDVVVTEELETSKYKSKHTLALLAAIARTAEHNQLLDVSVPREHRYSNKYAEADALVELYPELAPWKPLKRRFYDNEPRNTVLFEALALAEFLRSRDVS